MAIAGNHRVCNMLLSHVELYVQDVVSMERFYTEGLGFVVTDRGAGANGMVFLSRSPSEHHQIVLNPRPSHHLQESPVDHLSFRVAAIADLRACYRALLAAADIEVQTVSHGSTWSLYFRDPEHNRLEVFTDTPWYVHQPCKFAVDLAQSDQALLQFTEQQIKDLPGFSAAADWHASHRSQLEPAKV